MTTSESQLTSPPTPPQKIAISHLGLWVCSRSEVSVPSALEIFRWFVCFDGDDKRMTASSASQPASPRANSDYCLPPPQALIILPRQGAVLQVHIPAVCVTHGHTNRHKHTNRNINTDTDTYLHQETLYSQVEHSPLKGELKC